MNESKISVRYAKAFFEAALDENILEEIRNDVLTLSALIKQSAELKNLIDSPILSTSKKRAFFKSVFQSKIQKLSANFVDLMINNKREIYLPSSFRYFNELYKKKMGIKSAELTTAVELDEKSLKKIEDTIRSLFNVKIELTTQVDENIIGGLMIRVDDQQYDMSVAAKLKDIENSLLNA